MRRHFLTIATPILMVACGSNDTSDSDSGDTGYSLLVDNALVAKACFGKVSTEVSAPHVSLEITLEAGQMVLLSSSNPVAGHYSAYYSSPSEKGATTFRIAEEYLTVSCSGMSNTAVALDAVDFYLDDRYSQDGCTVEKGQLGTGTISFAGSRDSVDGPFLAKFEAHDSAIGTCARKTMYFTQVEATQIDLSDSKVLSVFLAPIINVEMSL